MNMMYRIQHCQPTEQAQSKGRCYDLQDSVLKTKQNKKHSFKNFSLSVAFLSENKYIHHILGNMLFNRNIAAMNHYI